MNKRITSLAMAAASIPAALALTAGPALAQDSGANACDTSYPAGQPFKLRVSPAQALVRRGAVVNLSTRLVRGNSNCPGRRVGFYLRGRGRSQYVLTQNTNPTTDSNGLRSIAVKVNDDFRFFANYSSASTLYARSATGLVQVRR